jgi:hypothetical protein
MIPLVSLLNLIERFNSTEYTQWKKERSFLIMMSFQEEYI